MKDPFVTVIELKGLVIDRNRYGLTTVRLFADDQIVGEVEVYDDRVDTPALTIGSSVVVPLRVLETDTA